MIPMEEKKFTSEHFYFNTLALEDAPSWGMSFRAAGSMRFRWNETNDNRIAFLKSIAGHRTVAAVELIHSHVVFAVGNFRARELRRRSVAGDRLVASSDSVLVKHIRIKRNSVALLLAA